MDDFRGEFRPFGIARDVRPPPSSAVELFRNAHEIDLGEYIVIYFAIVPYLICTEGCVSAIVKVKVGCSQRNCILCKWLSDSPVLYDGEKHLRVRGGFNIIKWLIQAM